MQRFSNTPSQQNNTPPANHSSVRIQSSQNPPISSEQGSPKREWFFILMAIALVVVILVGTLFGVMRAAPYVTYGDIVEFTNLTCIINDRFDQPIYKEGAVTDYSIFGNLIGYEEDIHNALLYKHSDLLCPEGVSSVLGHKSLEAQPRVMNTTLLSAESQQEIVDMFGKASGCCFAYNYETGEVYMALSLPAYVPNSADASYINRCFNSVYIPGSTMKMVTAALAIDQGKDVENLYFVCNKSYELSDGNEIICTGNHGRIGFSAALAHSCNCYFAQLIQSLNLDKALETLKKLGFSVNGSPTEADLIDRLTKETSSTNITNTSSFKNVWGLIGQGQTQANPIDMARIAAAIVNGGKAAQPYLVSSVINPNEDNEIVMQAKTTMTTLLSEETANKTKQYWKDAVNYRYYSYYGMSERIDFAKTGTAEQGNGTSYKLLVGTVESAKTAFYIVIEGEYNITPMKIANKLAGLLPSNG